MELSTLLTELKIVDFIKAFVSGDASDSDTARKMKKELDKKMPGTDMTKGEYFLKKMQDKGMNI